MASNTDNLTEILVPPRPVRQVVNLREDTKKIGVSSDEVALESNTKKIPRAQTYVGPSGYDIEFPKYLYYPSIPEDYQTMFLRMELFSERQKNRTPDTTIYLPLPLGALREESGMSWGYEDLGISGEAGKAIANYATQKFNNVPGYESFTENFKNIFKDSGRALNTVIERSVVETELELIEAVKQGLGVQARRNFTFMFEGIGKLRDFRLEWKLIPKNIHDARTIERIIKVIQKASLPSISPISMFDEIVVRLPYTSTDKPDRKAGDVVHGQDFEHKLYSSTFIIPNEFKLSAHERTSLNYAQFNSQLDHIVDFPLPFVVVDCTVQFGGESSEADAYLEEDGEIFHTSYFISLGFQELTNYTADNVKDYITYNR